mmetsp:Transcript_25738/g.73515  ORF Transcript_25738/g.73515 Transcript_25738/m.73515 type:complete len:672 (+) Transcript_25738:331-2346(+)
MTLTCRGSVTAPVGACSSSTYGVSETGACASLGIGHSVVACGGSPLMLGSAPPEPAAAQGKNAAVKPSRTKLMDMTDAALSVPGGSASTCREPGATLPSEPRAGTGFRVGPSPPRSNWTASTRRSCTATGVNALMENRRGKTEARPPGVATARSSKDSCKAARKCSVAFGSTVVCSKRPAPSAPARASRRNESTARQSRPLRTTTGTTSTEDVLSAPFGLKLDTPLSRVPPTAKTPPVGRNSPSAVKSAALILLPCCSRGSILQQLEPSVASSTKAAGWAPALFASGSSCVWIEHETQSEAGDLNGKPCPAPSTTTTTCSTKSSDTKADDGSTGIQASARNGSEARCGRTTPAADKSVSGLGAVSLRGRMLGRRGSDSSFGSSFPARPFKMSRRTEKATEGAEAQASRSDTTRSSADESVSPPSAGHAPDSSSALPEFHVSEAHSDPCAGASCTSPREVSATAPARSRGTGKVVRSDTSKVQVPSSPPSSSNATSALARPSGTSAAASAASPPPPPSLASAARSTERSCACSASEARAGASAPPPAPSFTADRYSKPSASSCRRSSPTAVAPSGGPADASASPRPGPVSEAKLLSHTAGPSFNPSALQAQTTERSSAWMRSRGHRAQGPAESSSPSDLSRLNLSYNLEAARRFPSSRYSSAIRAAQTAAPA